MTRENSVLDIIVSKYDNYLETTISCFPVPSMGLVNVVRDSVYMFVTNDQLFIYNSVCCVFIIRKVNYTLCE